MKLVFEKSAANFLKVNEEMLLQNETRHNLMLGLADQISTGIREATAPLYISCYEGDKLVGQAIRTDAHTPLSLGLMDNDLALTIGKELQTRGEKVVAVIGEMENAKTFADFWLDGAKYSNHIDQGIFELRTLKMPELDDGRVILATEEHREILIDFCIGFINDCYENPYDQEIHSKEVVARHLPRNEVFLWLNKNDEVCSMAIKNRESKNGATISYVYTPPRHRRKGYGARVTACLSQKILYSGKQFCNLYTDLANPTSNSIYQKIGYKKIGESIHISF